MKLLQAINALLTLIGRFGAQGFVVAVIFGLAFPQLAQLFRPLLAPVQFIFLAIMFARTDFRPIAAMARRPAQLAYACLWLIVVPLVVTFAVIVAMRAAPVDPGLILGLAIMAAAPPVISAPAIAMLFRFEPSLIIAAVVLTTALAPVFAPFATEALAGAHIPMDARALALRLALLIGGGMAAGVALRLVFGSERVAGARQQLDGAIVILFAVFAAAAMDGVTHMALAQPWTVAGYLALACAITAVGFGVSMALLRSFTPTDRFLVAYGSGQRNMGLLIAAMGAAVPQKAYLFFSLAQIPIFVTPQLLSPLARRLQAQSATTGP